MRRSPLVAILVTLLVLLPTGVGSVAMAAPKPPKQGAPCPKLGLVWENQGMLFKCVKKGKKLVWKKMPSGGGGSGGDDYSTQPVPADGKWRVPAGFPDDLPPMGWKGEPNWFVSNWDVLTAQPVGRACPQYPLTHLATDLAKLDSITPQGFMQPGSHAMAVPHMYYNTGSPTGAGKDPNGFAYNSEIVDVIAPGDMVLRGLVKQDVERAGARFSEYMMAFSVCGNLWMFTAHIDNVPAEFLAAAKASPRQRCQQAGQTADTQDCFYEYLRLPVQAGTKIGTSSGRAHGFDFGFTDTSQPAPGKLDPGAFSPRWAAGVCHTKYYEPGLRAQIEAKIDGNNGCGQLVSDVAGTAAGMWLAQGKRDMSQVEDYHIALAKHWADKDKLAISIGTNADVPGVPSGLYELTPTASGSNRAFALVKPGEIVCYDRLILRRGMVPGPTVYITMQTGSVEKLQIVGTTGSCPTSSSAMPAGAKTFERRNTLG